MMSNALYWHIEVIEMTHEKRFFGEIHKVENNYCSGFFRVENEGLQFELSIDFVSFNRYTPTGWVVWNAVYIIHSTQASILCFKYPFDFNRGLVDLWKQGFVESSIISNDLSLIIISFKLLPVHPLLSCPRQPSTLYLFCQYAGCFMGIFKKSFPTSKQEINPIEEGTKPFA